MTIERPYQSESGRFEFARSATTWLTDIEAYLAELELSTMLAPTVAGLMDLGYSLSMAVEIIQVALI